jgi:hypothetical protein
VRGDDWRQTACHNLTVTYTVSSAVLNVSPADKVLNADGEVSALLVAVIRQGLLETV